MQDAHPSAPAPAIEPNLTPKPIHPGTRIGHVHLKVADLDRALAFYCGVLGFELMQRYGAGAAFLSAGGYHHHLGTNTWAPGPSPSPDQAQLVEWTLVVPTPADAASIGDRMAAAGVAVESDGAARLLRDPWGTRVRITA